MSGRRAGGKEGCCGAAGARCPSGSPCTPLTLGLSLGHLRLTPSAPCSFLRQRFDATEAQLAAEGEEDEGVSLALDDLTDRLSRLEAAKAFYQCLGAWVDEGGPIRQRETDGHHPCQASLAQARCLPLALPLGPAHAASRSAGFLELEQQEPYGGIVLRRGVHL